MESRSHADVPAQGDCFEIASRLLLNRERFSGEACLEGVELYWMVHGVVVGQGPAAGLRFSHAWVEGARRGVRVAIDFSNGNRFVGPAELYYAIGRIDPAELVTYSVDTARRRLVDHQHYGPWEGAALAIGL